jgi:hypothetical protein
MLLSKLVSPSKTSCSWLDSSARCCAGSEQSVALLILASLADEITRLGSAAWREVEHVVAEGTPCVLRAVMPLIQTEVIGTQAVLSVRCVNAWLGIRPPESASTRIGTGAL